LLDYAVASCDEAALSNAFSIRQLSALLLSPRPAVSVIGHLISRIA